MRLKFCAACGSRTEDLEHHFIILLADGGPDDPTNQLTLCFGCFVKVKGERKPVYRIEDLVEVITPENRHEEV